MQDETAALVYAVMGQALNLKHRLDRGESPSMAAERAALERLLQEESEARRYADLGSQLEIRYALACWVDELFILDSPWAAEWNEHKLEVALFGTNDRAWKFWEKARRAGARSGGDVLEVYYLCVMLGFRGELRGEPDPLRAWVSTARAQVEVETAGSWSPPPELDVPTAVPPLRGRERFQTMALRSAVALLMLIPVVAFLVVLQMGR